jgi:hypothetical protein
MASSATEDALWEVVRSRRQGLLATIGAEGFPHLTNVDDLVDDDGRAVLLTTPRCCPRDRNLIGQERQR